LPRASPKSARYQEVDDRIDSGLRENWRRVIISQYPSFQLKLEAPTYTLPCLGGRKSAKVPDIALLKEDFIAHAGYGCPFILLETI
jgi:hypothetical protein